jgi:hypothetical protein
MPRDVIILRYHDKHQDDVQAHETYEDAQHEGARIIIDYITEYRMTGDGLAEVYEPVIRLLKDKKFDEAFDAWGDIEGQYITLERAVVLRGTPMPLLPICKNCGRFPYDHEPRSQKCLFGPGVYQET